MTIHSVIQTGIGRAGRHWHWLAPVALTAALLGCASTGTARKEPTPRQDFLEYRQLVVQAMGQVDAALRALDEVAVQANRNPRPAYEAFAKAVQRLEVDSVRVRARAQAIRVRGDAYFEHWNERVEGVKDEHVRKLAEEHSAELKGCFKQARLGAQDAREAFRSFLSDLQKLRAVLEADPSLVRIDAQKSLILAAKDHGRQVQQGLDHILAEMNTMTALLTPPGTTPKH